jgi:hypothetical protein
MTWTTSELIPFEGKQTVGNITATWNAGAIGEFIYYGSVNQDIPETIAVFIQQAVEARDKANNPSPSTVEIQDLLNGAA